MRARIEAVSSRVDTHHRAMCPPTGTRTTMKTQADFRAMLIPSGTTSSTPSTTASRKQVAPPTRAPPDRPTTSLAHVAGEPLGSSDWGHLQLTRGQLSMQPAMLRGVLKQCAPKLRAVDLSGCGDYVQDTAVVALASGCPALQTLDVSGCSVSDSALFSLATNCPALQELSVAGGCELSDAGVAAVLRNCTALVALDCRRCSSLSAAAFVVCEQQHPKLDLAAIQHAWEQSFDCEGEQL